MTKRQIVFRMSALGYSVWQIAQVVEWTEAKVASTLHIA